MTRGGRHGPSTTISYDTMDSYTSFQFTLSEHDQVKNFLDKCHLSQYYAKFIEEGFESLQAVLEITEDDLIALNVKRGHRRVMQRGIATLNGIPTNQPLHVVVAVPNGPPPSRSKRNNNGNQSSEGSSGTYTTSGYGSMTSPRLSASAMLNTSSVRKSYDFFPTSYTTNKNDKMGSSHPHQLYQFDRSPVESEPNDMIDAAQKESRSSYSSHDDEEEEQPNNGNPSTTSRKYRRHPKPDKCAPIKPPSAYIMFSNNARAQLKGQNMTFVETAKIIGDQWKNLDVNQKQQYERSAMRAKDEYIDTLNEYRKTSEYEEYQKYLSNFKAEQDATNRKIARLRKMAKRSSPGSGSLADSSSNDIARSSSSSGGSTDMYTAHRKTQNKGSSSEEGSLLQSKDTTPTIEISTPLDQEECYSPQQRAPPLISDVMAKSNYHRLPFNEPPQQQ